MDEVKAVEIKSDSGTDSIGKSDYLIKASGVFNKNDFRASAYIAAAMMVALFMTSFLGTRKNMKSTAGKEFDSPGFTNQVPLSSPRILGRADAINIVGSRKIEKSALGKIKIVQLRSLSELPVGSEARAILVSGATDGIVKAKLTSALMVDGEPILPEQTTLFGKGRSSDERLFVEFQKVIFPSGESYSIRAQAFDMSDKILGLKGALVGTRTRKMGMAMGLGFLGGMADGLRETSGSSLFGVQQKPSVRDAALAGASKAALDQSESYLDDMKKSPTIIEVKAGTEFLIIIDEGRRKDEE